VVFREAFVNADIAKQASALGAFTLLARFHGVALNPAQIRHRFGGVDVGVPEMLRCAKELGLKARAVNVRAARLANTPVPAIAECVDGSFVVLGKVGSDQVLIQEPAVPTPKVIALDEFRKMWSGRLVLIARRAGLTDLTRRFDIAWFLRAM